MISTVPSDPFMWIVTSFCINLLRHLISASLLSQNLSRFLIIEYVLTNLNAPCGVFLKAALVMKRWTEVMKAENMLTRHNVSHQCTNYFQRWQLLQLSFNFARHISDYFSQPSIGNFLKAQCDQLTVPGAKRPKKLQANDVFFCRRAHHETYMLLDVYHTGRQHRFINI